MAILKRENRDGTVKYAVRVRDLNRNWYPTKTFPRMVDAQKYERALDLQRDQSVAAAPSDARKLTVSEYIERWKTECRNKASEGWQISQNQMIRDYIIPVIGSRRIGEIKPGDIGLVIRKVKDMGRCDQMQLHIYNLLHKIFDTAVEYHDIVDKNPVTKRDRPQVMVRERVVLNPSQAKVLLAAAKGSYIGPAIWIGMLAALRPNEIQGLKWNAVDFERGLIHIKAGYKRKVKRLEAYPKQKKHGSSPMIGPLRDYLEELAKGKSTDDFVVGGIEKSMLDHGTFGKHLRDLCEELKLPVITPHGLRHSCTEIWCEQGASEEDIVRLLNQSGAGSVRRYIHKTPAWIGKNF